MLPQVWYLIMGGGAITSFLSLKEEKPTCTSLVVSFPFIYYLSQSTLLLEILSPLPLQSLPETWTVAANTLSILWSWGYSTRLESLELMWSSPCQYKTILCGLSLYWTCAGSLSQTPPFTISPLHSHPFQHLSLSFRWLIAYDLWGKSWKISWNSKTIVFLTPWFMRYASLSVFYICTSKQALEFHNSNVCFVSPGGHTAFVDNLSVLTTIRRNTMHVSPSCAWWQERPSLL